MTPTPAQSQQIIRRVVAALRAGRVPAPEDAELVSAGLEFLLETSARGGTFRRAFCLDGDYAVDLLSERDRLLVKIAATFYPGLSAPGAAKEIAAEWTQYHRGVLQHDLARGRCSEPPGTLRSKLFELAQLDREMPGRRRIRDILFEAASQDLEIIGSDRKLVCADFQ